MSWQTEMTTILRSLLGDVVAPYTYSDERLQQVILTAAQLVTSSVSFPVRYTVDMVGATLTPDPTASPRDNAFINLVSLKAACFIDLSELRLKSGKAIKVVDGRSSIDTSSLPNAYKIIIQEGACNLYKTALLEYQMGELMPGHAIFGPIASPNIYTGNGGDYQPNRVTERWE